MVSRIYITEVGPMLVHFIWIKSGMENTKEDIVVKISTRAAVQL